MFDSVLEWICEIVGYLPFADTQKASKLIEKRYTIFTIIAIFITLFIRFFLLSKKNLSTLALSSSKALFILISLIFIM